MNRNNNFPGRAVSYFRVYQAPNRKIRLLIEGREPDEIDRQANRSREAIGKRWCG